MGAFLVFFDGNRLDDEAAHAAAMQSEFVAGQSAYDVAVLRGEALLQKMAAFDASTHLPELAAEHHACVEVTVPNVDDAMGRQSELFDLETRFERLSGVAVVAAIQDNKTFYGLL